MKQHSVLFSDSQDGNDMRVLNRCRQLRLAQKTIPEALLGRQLGRDYLQGNRPRRLRLPCPVDHAHATAADQSLNPIPPEPVTRREPTVLFISC